MKQKDALEAELKALGQVLESQGCGMEDPLVDGEGFPRADIDVYQVLFLLPLFYEVQTRTYLNQVRHARHDIRSKGNDLKAVVRKIEAGLHSLHSQAREAAGGEVPRAAAPSPLHPFARVLVVVPGGPAEAAGVKQGDLMCKFGSVSRSNFNSLKNISDVADSSKGRPVEVVVNRGESTVRLRLTPNSGWGGQGLLGFKIRPLSPGESGSSSPDR